jgi:formamidopyrimidine-DNA glycosylase
VELLTPIRSILAGARPLALSGREAAMPELPDVENYKRYLDRTALQKTIKQVDVLSAQVVKKISARKFARALAGRKLTRSRRHGKHLFVRLDDGHWLALHFGMTGNLAYFKRNEDDPKFDRVRFDLTNGYHLAFVNQRKLGEVRMIDDPDDFIAGTGLGPDALDKRIDLKAFRQIVADGRGAIKSNLMDQSRLAGIGNVFSDEILFQARINPETPVAKLDDKEIARLYRTLRRVLKVAIDKGAGAEEFTERLPKSFLLRQREAGAKCPRCGGTVRTLKVSGRTAYYCPRCQPARH